MPSVSPWSARHGKRGNRGSGCGDFVTELNELQAGWRNVDVMRQVGSVIGDGVDAFHSDVSDVSKVIQLPLEPGMHLVFAEPARRQLSQVRVHRWGHGQEEQLRHLVIEITDLTLHIGDLVTDITQLERASLDRAAEPYPIDQRSAEQGQADQRER